MGRTAKQTITVFLNQTDFNRLKRICEERGISRADFLRCCLDVADSIPTRKTRRLSGACLERHKARLRRERRKAGKG